MLQKEQWQGFNGRIWREEINLREFIQDNYTPYDGDASFLEAPTEATDALSYQALLPINRVTFLSL